MVGITDHQHTSLDVHLTTNLPALLCAAVRTPVMQLPADVDQLQTPEGRVWHSACGTASSHGAHCLKHRKQGCSRYAHTPSPGVPTCKAAHQVPSISMQKPPLHPCPGRRTLRICMCVQVCMLALALHIVDPSLCPGGTK